MIRKEGRVQIIGLILVVILLALFLIAWVYAMRHILLFWSLYRPWRHSLHARGLGPRYWSYPITPNQWRRLISVARV